MAIDVTMTRERQRRRRLTRVALLLSPLAIWMWVRISGGNPISPGFPSLPEDSYIWLPMIIIVVLLGGMIMIPMIGQSKSPHTLFLPEQIEIGFDDVKGLKSVLSEVRRTLEVFLNHRRFSVEMGGRPRRGVLFEGPPGTGKTHVAKALAKEAGVPFLFVSATSFQSMWYGMTARKIRSYFRALRKVARREGGAIGFIEEFDAIGTKRGGMSGFSELDGDGRMVSSKSVSEGVGGVVNELLVQMQSFDDPPNMVRLSNWFKGRINRFLPPHRQLLTKPLELANILLIGATNRADSLDPALLRPGRFDRVLHFDLPGKSERQELVEFFLSTKAHDTALDSDEAHDEIASLTMGYTPASLERLFDEALLVAMREDRQALNAEDVRRARMEVEIGLPQPVDYLLAEKDSIAVHESGHAVTAYLVGKGRKLEVLSIIKRGAALGLLAHSDEEERFTKRSSEMRAMIQISMGGMVAEELFFDESGSGPAGDLAAATQVAADMVGSLGLGSSLVSIRAVDAGLMGGNLTARVLSDQRARDSVEKLLNDAKEDTRLLLGRHRYLVEALRQALLEREELVGEEILTVLRTAEMEAVAGGFSVVDLTEGASIDIELVEN
ncbi:MAG: AAA family ATPase [Acidimicrobiia bacterium]|nr:AAA family ATPase [Acidimicrobiia bacterium]